MINVYNKTNERANERIVAIVHKMTNERIMVSKHIMLTRCIMINQHIMINKRIMINEYKMLDSISHKRNKRMVSKKRKIAHNVKRAYNM